MHAGSRAETARWGKYEVLRPLAVGGMAEIYLARAADPERLVVIKRLRAQLAVEPEYVQMFLDEARLALTLHHPNVVEVYEVGEDAGRDYIAMEYLHGHDLRDTMARLTERHVRVQLAQALSVARAVAAALHYTHERTTSNGESLGIVHRDVSPHNVLLTYDGRVKLVDFGIAKTSSQRSRTRTGVLKGKAAYMAPEQALGMPTDRRSDLFSLGILLWEMTTGRWLYRQRTELDTLNAVAHSRPPRPSRVTTDYPRDLEKLVMKALARWPADRWATAAELIAAIDDLARRRKVTLGPERVSELTALAFADELAAWHAVQGFGISLADHLVAQHDREATSPAPSDLETEDDFELPPLPAFEMTRLERFSRARLRWPVLAGALASGVAAVWLGMRDPSRLPDRASGAAAPGPATSEAAAPRAPAAETAGSGTAGSGTAGSGTAGSGTAGSGTAPETPGTTAPVSGTATGITVDAATGSEAAAPAPADLAGGSTAAHSGSAAPAGPRPPQIAPPANPGRARPQPAVRDSLHKPPSAKPSAKPAPAMTPGVPGERAPVARPPRKPTDADLDKLP